MLEPLYYKLSEAERLLSVSRDTLLRFERAGLLTMHGKNHGKRVTGASLRALALRIEQGEDLWHAVQQSESPAPSAPKPMAKAQSTKTKRDDGGTSRQPKTASDSLADEPLQSRPLAWSKKII